ncbi:unnamed protein product, partial [Litomosoides sigmodontis]
ANNTLNNLCKTVPYDRIANIQKILIEEKYRPHHVLLANYSPPFYCKPLNAYPYDVQKYVDSSTSENLIALRKYWKRWQQNKTLELFQLSLPFSVSATGLPMNPNGRQGIAGRGNHLKFGANLLNVYVVIRRSNHNHLMILLERNTTFPIRAQPSNEHCDKELQFILRNILLDDSSINIFSSQNLLNIGETSNGVAHVKRVPVVDVRDTDNAWTEHDIWAIFLGSQPPEVAPETDDGSLNWQCCGDKNALSVRDREYLSASLAFFSDAQ